VYRQVTRLLVGRDVEESQLRDLVRGVAKGVGRSVLVEGEPGIGKSLLISTGLAEAAELGCRVLRAAADEFGGRFPLRVLLDCFADHGAGEVAGLTGGEWGNVISGAYDPVLAAMERLLEAVDKLCARSPVVLVIDDLQWADEPSLAVWGQLGRLVAQLPLLLMAACRPEPLRSELVGLRQTLESHDAVMVRLGPLTRDQTVALVGDLLDAPPGPRLTRLAVQAGGNPLYVRELVDVLAREGRLNIEPGVIAEVERGGDLPVPTSLRAAIAGRIGSMSQSTQRILQSAALLGPEFSVTDLAGVRGKDAAELADALMEAYRANVLVDSGARTMFRHPLIRQALYEAIPAGLRAALHRQAAQALAETGAPVERVAEQLQAASGVMDAWMLGWLVDNGAALVNRASQPAIDLLTRAAERVPRTDPRRETIESRMATALRRMMRFGELQRHTRAVLASDGISTEHRLEMSWALAYSLLYSDPTDGARVAREALASDDGGRWGARVHAMYALTLAFDRHSDTGAAIRAAHAAAQRTGDRWAMATALQTDAIVAEQKNIEMCVELYRQALAVLGDDPRASDQRMALLANVTWNLDDMGQVEEADAAFADMLALAEKYPSGMSQTRMQVFAALRRYWAGRWDDALAELESMELRLEHGYFAVLGLSTKALIALHRDDRPAAAASLGIMAKVDLGDDIVRNHSSWLIQARALSEERGGRPRRAFEILMQMLDPERYVNTAVRFGWIPELVRLALAVGERDAAQAGTALAAGDAEREALPLRVAAASACRGLLDGDAGLLLAAAEGFGAGRRVLDRGMALENAAVLLAERGQVPQARDALAAALAEYAGLGAAWDAIRAEARMRPFGVRRGQRGPRDRRPATGWEALTPTELRVAFLVADGLSNPAIAAELFSSRRTVQTHVSHILAKLGARSRVEVASEAAKHRSTSRDDSQAPRSRSAS
jgi:DNA-binding CsgD family transcriptional regulator